MFSVHLIYVAYLGFHTLLYFEHQVFLALDNVFSYYNKDTAGEILSFVSPV